MMDYDIEDEYFRQKIPLFQNENFLNFCRNYAKATEKEQKELYHQFGDFEIEEGEKITLKTDIDPKEWRKTVNYDKLRVYSYICSRAVIDLATKLDEGAEPLDAMNYMAGRNLPTGLMQAVIFHNIDKFHPRGEEVMKEWKAYCDSVYGNNG